MCCLRIRPVFIPRDGTPWPFFCILAAWPFSESGITSWATTSAVGYLSQKGLSLFKPRCFTCQAALQFRPTLAMSLRILICGGGIAGPTLAFWLTRGKHTPPLLSASRLKSLQRADRSSQAGCRGCQADGPSGSRAD